MGGGEEVEGVCVCVLNESPTFLELRWRDWRAHTSVMAKWRDMTVYGAQHTLVSWVRLKPVDTGCTLVTVVIHRGMCGWC